MARFSVKTFLSHAKRQLQQASQTNAKTTFVVGNESADLDSIASAILYGYITSSSTQALRSNTLTIPLTNIPAADLSLRPELTTLLRHANLAPSDLITLSDLPPNLSPTTTTLTLVDHNALTGPLATLFPAPTALTACIDHHADENLVPATSHPRLITASGSCASLVATHLHDAWVQLALFSSSTGAANGQQSYDVIDDTAYTSTWDAQAALLALGAVLVDTQNLTSAHKVTAHDRRAVKLLEAFVNISPKLGVGYDRGAFYGELEAAKSDIGPLALGDVLRKDYKAWSDGGSGVELGVASVVRGLGFLEEKAAGEARGSGGDGDGGKEALLRACAAFARERGLGLFAVMTAFTNGEGEFERELLLMAAGEGKPVEAAEKFVKQAGGQLKLVDLSGYEVKGDGIAWVKAWRQDSLEASRKQVAPLLREAMKV